MRVRNNELSRASEYFAKKLAPKWLEGMVVKKWGEDTYGVLVKGTERKIHANDLLKWGV